MYVLRTGRHAPNRNHNSPPNPAVRDAVKIAIFDALISSVSPAKARSVIKIDIVKSIPPSSPASAI